MSKETNIIDFLKEKQDVNDKFVKSNKHKTHLHLSIGYSCFRIDEKRKTIGIVCDNITDKASGSIEEHSRFKAGDYTVIYHVKHAANNLACSGYCKAIKFKTGDA